MKSVKTFIKIFLLLVAISSTAQDWAKVENLPETEFTGLEIIDGIIFTASGHTLFYSYDQGEHWQQSLITSESIHPDYFKKFGDRLYVGVYGQGIYSAPFDNLNAAWTKVNNVSEVSSFAEYNGSLYASTMGFGIYKLNENNAWVPFINGLPSYSFNVNKLVATSQSLLAIAGANGTFYEYDFTQHQWIEKLYSLSYLPGLSFDDGMFLNDKLYVSNGRRLLRSDDSGNSWTSDQNGLVLGISRFLYRGSKSLYAYTANFDPSTNDNFTFLRKRSNTAAGGNSWAEGSDFLPFYVYAIGESGNKIFAAAQDGLHFKMDASLETDIPIPDAKQIVIYPNPSTDGSFILKSTLTVCQMEIYELSGKLLSIQNGVPDFYNFHVPRQGIYLVKVIAENTVAHFKIIAGS